MIDGPLEKPVSFVDWYGDVWLEHDPEPDPTFECGDTLHFVMDDLPLAYNESANDLCQTLVVGTFGATLQPDVALPVFQMRPAEGVVVWASFDFDAWRLSVSSVRGPVEVNPYGLWEPAKEIYRHKFRGFDRSDQVYGPYAYDKSRFSMEMFRKERVWAFMFNLWQSFQGLRCSTSTSPSTAA